MARTIDWIVFETGANIGAFHLVGFGLGAHQVAVAGRNVQSGRIPYITGENLLFLFTLQKSKISYFDGLFIRD